MKRRTLMVILLAGLFGSMAFAEQELKDLSAFSPVGLWTLGKKSPDVFVFKEGGTGENAQGNLFWWEIRENMLYLRWHKNGEAVVLPVLDSNTIVLPRKKDQVKLFRKGER